MELTATRFMAPGIEHFVITIEDSLCIGGNFYCKQTMRQSVTTMMQEHALVNVSNTEHDKHLVLLVQMTFCLYADLTTYGLEGLSITRSTSIDTYTTFQRQ